MIRGVASKVMWVGRATVFLVGLAVILALVFGAASAALGANGKPFILGKGNVATKVSALTNKGLGAALSLNVQPDQPPLAVNSQTKVANLNADQLDGKDSTAFQSANAAAGGDLSGSYPNPQIATGGVGSNEVANGSLRVGDIAAATITSTIDLSILGSGSCTEVAIPRGEVNPGDLPIFVAPDSHPFHLDVVPQLTNQDDVLAVNMCNTGNIALDPPSLTYTFVLLRP